MCVWLVGRPGVCYRAIANLPPPKSFPHDSRIVVRLVAAALAFRLISALLALLVNLSFPLQQREQFTVFESSSPFWDTFARYDSGWYQQIATNGYVFVPGGPSAGIGKPGKIAFFPVYPLSMRYTGKLFNAEKADVYLGGILVSWISFIAASVMLFKLARLDLNSDNRQRGPCCSRRFFRSASFSVSSIPRRCFSC